MNLNAAPTRAQLTQLIAECDDMAGHHVLWVDKTGAVYLSTMASEQDSSAFEERHPEAQLRFETFQKGKEYVGPAAAQDDEWITWLFSRLLSDWGTINGKRTVEYVPLP